MYNYNKTSRLTDAITWEFHSLLLESLETRAFSAIQIILSSLCSGQKVCTPIEYTWQHNLPPCFPSSRRKSGLYSSNQVFLFLTSNAWKSWTDCNTMKKSLVTLRFALYGCKNRPFFYIVATNRYKPRNRGYLEQVKGDRRLLQSNR